MTEASMQHLIGSSALTAERLELMGKYAAKVWREGQYPDLSTAVTETTKEAGLVPEQLRRVIEFANTDAFLEAFHKMGSAGHKYVDFGAGVLADPAKVIGEINTKIASATPVYDLSDYAAPPTTTYDKHASVEEAFWNAFKSEAEPIPLLNPDAEYWDMWNKTASVHKDIVSMMDQMDMYRDTIDYNLVHAVKEAAAEGYELGDVLKVFSAVCAEPVLCKTAFELAVPELLRSGLLANHEKVAESIEKTSSANWSVDLDSPVAKAYRDYCDHIVKSAALRDEMRDVSYYFGKLEQMRKEAGVTAAKPGMLGRTFQLFEQAAPLVGDWAKKHVKNEAWKDVVGAGAELATQAAPLAVVGGGAYLAHDALQRKSPTYNALTGAASSVAQGGANAIANAVGVAPAYPQMYHQM